MTVGFGSFAASPAHADVPVVCRPLKAELDRASSSGDTHLITEARARIAAARGACPDLAAETTISAPHARRIPPNNGNAAPARAPTPLTSAQTDLAKLLARYPKATKGDAAQQIAVGRAFATAEGVTQDFGQAIAWYQKAADAGDAAGEFNLGWTLARVTGPTQNEPAARTWLQKAAEQRHVAAARELSAMLYDGRGGQKDFPGAFKWANKAADAGDACAINDVGLMYANGEGVARDPAKAVEYFRAGESECATGRYYLAQYYLRGVVVGTDRTIAIGLMRSAAADRVADAITWLSEQKIASDMGYMGATVQNLTPEMAEALGLGAQAGALVNETIPNGPSDVAGLRMGDIVIGANAHAVRSSTEITWLVEAAEVKSNLRLEVLRDGKTLPLEFRVVQRPPGNLNQPKPPQAPREEGSTTLRRVVLGATLGELKYGVTGVLFVSAPEKTPLSDLGLKPGDLIIRANNKPVTDAVELNVAVEAARKLGRQHILLATDRAGTVTYVAATLR